MTLPIAILSGKQYLRTWVGRYIFRGAQVSGMRHKTISATCGRILSDVEGMFYLRSAGIGVRWPGTKITYLVISEVYISGGQTKTSRVLLSPLKFRL